MAESSTGGATPSASVGELPAVIETFALDRSSNDDERYYDHNTCIGHELIYPQKLIADDCGNSSCATTVNVTDISSSSENSLDALRVLHTHTSILNITDEEEDSLLSITEQNGEDELSHNVLLPDDDHAEFFMDPSLIGEVHYVKHECTWEPATALVIPSSVPTIAEGSTNSNESVDEQGSSDQSAQCSCVNRWANSSASSTSALRIPPTPKNTHPVGNVSYVEQMLEHVFEGLCFAGTPSGSTSVQCRLQPNFFDLLGCGTATPAAGNEFLAAQSALARLLCQDSSANHDEVDVPGPKRANMQQRSSRVRRLKRSLGGGGTAPPAVRYTRSMLEPSDDTGTDPEADDDGYDSDPAELLLRRRSESPSSVVETPLHVDDDGTAEDSEDIHPIVQNTLNTSLSTIWHEPTGSSTTPIGVTAWMERGTLIKGKAVMVEPRLVWKSNSSETLHSIRLLHICRVRAVSELDRSLYPLARPSTCFLVRATTPEDDVHEDYLFQARTLQERDAIVLRWKLTVARFATLAVLEDATTILAEFFVSSSSFPPPLRINF